MSESRWWASLRHGGLLITPSRIAEFFPSELQPLPLFTVEKLRREWLRSRSDDANHELLDIVLEWVCGLNNAYGRKWVRGSDVDTSWSRRALTGEVIRPRRIWLAERGAVLSVFVDSETRLGVGRGRRAVARVVEWLRATGHKLALLTNGRQFRLLYAGSDYEAWAEWDAALWFEDGTPGAQVDAFRALLSVDTLVPKKEGEASALLAAIELSRKGQAELSDVLGERVRRAVELLLQAHGKALDSQLASVPPRDIYRAAARIIMRLVVGFFAEARDLLPRDNPVYHHSYGLNGLREQLGPFAATGERLRSRFGAHSRLLALFRLIYEGSHHEALPVMRYGGGLFTPGDAGSSDPVSIALATLERGNHDVSDDVVASILDLLCTTRVKVRQGRARTWVAAPVDFSDLSSEYIGILYEGLLDYELKRCADDDPTVFLALGTQPALPLSRLEAMDDRALKNLVEALKKKDKGDTGDEGEEEEEDEGGEEQEEEETADQGDDAGEEEVVLPEEPDSPRVAALRRARAWARRAAVVGGLVARRGRRRNLDDDPELEAAAKRLVPDLAVRLPGQWFLVRWGGTRKGHGTFYTRPQLTVPVVQRTLRPLAYDAPPDEDGKPDELAPAAAWTPKRPADILSLKVCDPAMGSGSFLVAALRFLTDALFASLHHHGCIAPQTEGALVSLPFGDAAAGKLSDLLLPLRPDADDFELRLRAQLKRFVLERCLYGVDIDPLAVELARLSLWVETMDRDMPFEFLRHKFKNGNSLIGCWFDRYRDYPALAWAREGGDKDREGVHHEKSKWTRAISQMKDGVRESLVDVLTNQLSLLNRPSGDAEGVHDSVATALVALHQPPVADPEEQDARYRKSVENLEDLVKLREAFDTWCAIWFWPADQLDLCPLAHDLLSPSEDARTVVRRLQAHHRFFHWDLEFPDVFDGSAAGFDAIVGNPPWEIQKPNSLEFFSNLDPLYRSYTKTEALARQKELFVASEPDERAWVGYNAELKAKSNWVKNAGNPWGDGLADTEKFSLGRGQLGAQLHGRWADARARRRSYGDPGHPCRHQGSSDINTYKLFLEQAHALLRRHGMLGMLVPSGVYSDLGSRELRALFLERCNWRWLYSFQNARYVFNDVRDRVKIAAIGVQKGGSTQALAVRFRLGPAGSPEASELEADIGDPARFLSVSYDDLVQFSPQTRALVEVVSARDLQLLEKVYERGVLLGVDPSWGIDYAREFDATKGARVSVPRAHLDVDGVYCDELGRWELLDGVRGLPFYQGLMVQPFDFSAKSWVSGTGPRAKWVPVPWTGKTLGPQFVMDETAAKASEKFIPTSKVGVRRVARSDDERTVFAALIPGAPCSDKLAVLYRKRLDGFLPALVAVLNSSVFNYCTRQRVAGTQVDEHVLRELPLLHLDMEDPALAQLALGALQLNAASPMLADCWVSFAQRVPRVRTQAWRSLWAITEHERLRLRAGLDAVATALYGLNEEDLRWILRSCDFPVVKVCAKPFSRTLDTKGFWRVEKKRDPELRQTVLVQVAFGELQAHIRREKGSVRNGVAAFLATNDGEGWPLPETLRLADYDLGHDDRAKEPQPVASRLGPRFLPWQLEQSAEDSWAECERHARAIVGDAEFERLTTETGSTASTSSTLTSDPARVPVPRAVGAAQQGSLFSAEGFQRTPAPPARPKKPKK